MPVAARENSVLALGEQDYFSDLPVILTASRLPQQQMDLPAAVTVIDRTLIEASGVMDIPSLFRLVAGFQVGHNRDQRTSVTSHGASDQFSRRMQVLVDGRSIYTPVTGGVDWLELPVSLEDIERIEVTRGPNGVSYGANAFLGIINIITIHPADVKGFTFKTTLGEDRYRKGTLRYGGRSGAVDYRLTVERREDSGHVDLDPDPDKGIRKQANDDQRTIALNLRADWRASVNDYLSLQLGDSRGPRERGYGPEMDEVHHAMHARGNYQQLQWRHIHSSTNEFKVQFYHHYQTEPDDTVLNVAPRIGFDYSIKAERFDLELEQQFSLARNWRASWGGEVRQDRARVPGFMEHDGTIKKHLYRLFANAEWRPDALWTVNFGSMIEHNEQGRRNVSPRLAVNHHLDERHYLRGSYSEAYRNPAFFEEYADAAVRLHEDYLVYPRGTIFDQLFISSGGLKPEHIRSYELAFGRQQSGGRLGYEIKLYREEIRDVIATYRDLSGNPHELANNGTYVFANDGHFNISGLELQARAHPTDKSVISLAYAYADSHGKDLFTTAPVVYRRMSTMTPRHTIGLLLASRLPAGWHGSVGYYRVTDFRWGGGSKVAYATVDVSLRRPFRHAGYQGTLFLGGRDLRGAYFDYRYDVYQIRRFYAGLELQFP